MMIRLLTLVYIRAEQWQQILDLAEQSHGLIRSGDISGLGVSRQMLRTAVKEARLVRVERGLYRLNGHPFSWRSALQAHCWTTGGRTFATSAAMLHQLGNPSDLSPGYAEVVVNASQRPRSRHRLRVHRSSIWVGVRTVHVDHIPTIPLAETLVSIGMHHRFEIFRTAFNHARRQRRITLPVLLAASERFLTTGQSNSRPLARSLELLVGQPELTLSEWSNQFADWCAVNGLPRPQLEFQIFEDGRLVAQVDACWPKARIVVELDSWAWHHDSDVFESDRIRYARLSMLGWTVVPITWKRWKSDSDALAADLRTALAASR